MSQQQQQQLPPLSQVFDTLREQNYLPDYRHSPLTRVFRLIFENSTALPDLVTEYTFFLRGHQSDALPTTYEQIVDQAIGITRQWNRGKLAQFIGGHPRIGEAKRLSALSEAEQGQVDETPQEVYHRLEYLNLLYERRYPGLVYITFVNGRSRTEIKEEMERRLVEEGVLSSTDEGGDEALRNVENVDSDKWTEEALRAVDDIAKIAKSRLSKLVTS